MKSYAEADDVGQILAYEVAVNIRPACLVRSTQCGGVAAKVLSSARCREFSRFLRITLGRSSCSGWPLYLASQPANSRPNPLKIYRRALPMNIPKNLDSKK